MDLLRYPPPSNPLPPPTPSPVESPLNSVLPASRALTSYGRRTGRGSRRRKPRKSKPKRRTPPGCRGSREDIAPLRHTPRLCPLLCDLSGSHASIRHFVMFTYNTPQSNFIKYCHVLCWSRPLLHIHSPKLHVCVIYGVMKLVSFRSRSNLQPISRACTIHDRE